MFAALKLAQQDVGPVHIAADIGCHAFATFEPFSMGHSILGYGMSLASRAGVSPMMKRRTLAVMGDGGFWHNGLLTGVQSALFNGDDAVLRHPQERLHVGDRHAGDHFHARRGRQGCTPPTRQQSRVHDNQVIEQTLRGHRRQVAAHRSTATTWRRCARRSTRRSRPTSRVSR